MDCTAAIIEAERKNNAEAKLPYGLSVVGTNDAYKPWENIK